MQSPALILKQNAKYAVTPAIVLVFGLVQVAYLSWSNLELAAAYALVNSMTYLFLQPLNGVQISATRHYQQGHGLMSMVLAMLPMAVLFSSILIVAVWFLQDWLAWSSTLKQNFWLLLSFMLPVHLVGQSVTGPLVGAVMAEKRGNFMFANSIRNNLIILGGLVGLELIGLSTITALALSYLASMVYQTSAYVWITRDLRWWGGKLSSYWQYWRQVVVMSSDVLIIALVMNVTMLIATDIGPAYAVLTTIIMQSNRLLLIPMKRLGVLFGTELDGKFDRKFILQSIKLVSVWVAIVSVLMLLLINWRSGEVMWWLLAVIGVQYLMEPITSMLSTMLKYTGHENQLLGFYSLSLLVFALPMLLLCNHFWPGTYWLLWMVLVSARLSLAAMVLALFQKESAKQRIREAAGNV